MLLKFIRNWVQLHRGFVYGAVRWSKSRVRRVLEIELKARKGSRPTCSGCGQRAAGYDVLSKRRFEFVPLWGIAVFFLYAIRRVACPRCCQRQSKIDPPNRLFGN